MFAALIVMHIQFNTSKGLADHLLIPNYKFFIIIYSIFASFCSYYLFKQYLCKRICWFDL